jgi:hypothetical protein
MGDDLIMDGILKLPASGSAKLRGVRSGPSAVPWAFSVGVQLDCGRNVVPHFT